MTLHCISDKKRKKYMSHNDSERIYFKSVFLLPSLHNSGKKRLFESPKILKWKNFFRENLCVILELRNAAGYDYELR